MKLALFSPNPPPVTRRIGAVALVLLTGCDDAAPTDQTSSSGSSVASSSASTTAASGTGGGTSAFDVSVEFVTVQGVALDGRPLLHSDPNGEIVELKELGIDGKATVTVNDGDQLTVFADVGTDMPFGFAVSARMKPGVTTVRAIAPSYTKSTSAMITLDVQCTMCANASKVAWSISCLGESTKAPVIGATQSFTSNFYACPGATAFDAFFVAFDALGTPIGASVSKNIPHTPGTFHLPDAAAPQTQAVQWDVVNSPAGAEVSRSIVSFPAGAAPTSGFTGYFHYSTAHGSTASETVVNEFLPNASALVSVFDPAAGTTRSRALRSDPFSFMIAPFDLNSIAPLLPTPGFDLTEAGRPRVSLTLGDGPIGDAFQVQLYAPNVLWILFDPASKMASLQLPKLNASLGAFVPNLASGASGGAVHMLEPSQTYAELLAHGIAQELAFRRDVADVTFSEQVVSTN